MAKNVLIKLKSASVRSGPFSLIDEYENIIATNISRNTLIQGVTYSLEDNVNTVTILSLGKCKNKRTFVIGTITPSEIAATKFVALNNSCVWTHLKNVTLYNSFYNNIEPYIIEYPFTYQFQDEILQNVKDYTRAYKYDLNKDFIFDEADKIETNDRWFNKAVVYNGQQSSGVLELVPKPLHNLKAYLQFPILNENSKTITYTKSDNFYQYNTFWNVVKDKEVPLFVKTCESMSIDKIVNQPNMVYTAKSFKKETLRAKGLKVRHILDDRTDTKLISQFIITNSQISYK